jgi:hypothetical protein
MEMIQKWKLVGAQVLRSWIDQHQSGVRVRSPPPIALTINLPTPLTEKSVTSVTKSEDEFLAPPDHVQKCLDRHAPGTRGTVYVSPDDPKQVQLNLEMNVHTLAAPLLIALAGVSLLLIGTSLWLMGTPTVFW